MKENPKELFVRVLSHARYGTERSAAIYKDLSDLAQNPDIQQALSARAFVAKQNIEKIDEAFRLIGEKPADVSGRFLDWKISVVSLPICNLRRHGGFSYWQKRSS